MNGSPDGAIKRDLYACVWKTLLLRRLLQKHTAQFPRTTCSCRSRHRLATWTKHGPEEQRAYNGKRTLFDIRPLLMKFDQARKNPVSAQSHCLCCANNPCDSNIHLFGSLSDHHHQDDLNKRNKDLKLKNDFCSPGSAWTIICHMPATKGLKSAAAAFSTRRRLLACYTGLLWRLHWFALAVTFSHFQQTWNIDAANHEFLTWADRRRIASYPIIPKASLVLRERFCAKFGARRSPPPPTCWERSHVHGREGAEANKKFRQTVVVRRTRFGKCHREKTLQLLSTVPIHKPAHLVHKQQWRKFNHIDLLKILAAGLDQRQSHFLKIHNIQIGSLLSFFH